MRVYLSPYKKWGSIWIYRGSVCSRVYLAKRFFYFWGSIWIFEGLFGLANFLRVYLARGSICNYLIEGPNSMFASHQSYSPAHRYSTLTLPCEIIAENGQRCRIICMLDNCGNLCVLRKSVADKLKMKGEKVDLELSVTGRKSVTFKRQRKVK